MSRRLPKQCEGKCAPCCGRCNPEHPDGKRVVGLQKERRIEIKEPARPATRRQESDK